MESVYSSVPGINFAQTPQLVDAAAGVVETESLEQAQSLEQQELAEQREPKLGLEHHFRPPPMSLPEGALEYPE